MALIPPVSLYSTAPQRFHIKFGQMWVPNQFIGKAFPLTPPLLPINLHQLCPRNPMDKPNPPEMTILYAVFRNARPATLNQYDYTEGTEEDGRAPKRTDTKPTQSNKQYPPILYQYQNSANAESVLNQHQSCNKQYQPNTSPGGGGI